MRPSLCQSFLSSLLKVLNFFHTFIGFTVIIYAVWILTRWDHDGPDELPAPWFACALMGVGVFMCLISIIGLVAAEVANGCCLFFYPILAALLILLEATLSGYVLLDRQWEADLPYDSTGELKRLRAFIEENMDVFKWVAMTVVVIQASSVLLAIVLRVMIPRRVEYENESDEDFLVIRSPFLSTQVIPTDTLNSVEHVENTGYYPVTWSSQMRQSIAQTVGKFRRTILG
ncbi:putative tetraspanin/Peripherin [Dioscorea sansibarensis]